MIRTKLNLSLLAVFLLYCIYYNGGLILLPIVFLPVLVHELSHVLALRLLGQRITGFTPDAGGFCIQYEGNCAPRGHIAAALAGPLGGALYALLGLTGIDWLEKSAVFSLLLTGFNLLPLLPLDGGRIFLWLCVLRLGEKSGEKLCRSVGSILLFLLLVGGLTLAVWKKSTVVLAAAVWLLLFQDEDVMKERQ